MSQYTIDLCQAWAKIGEVDGATFDGVVRNLKPGEWTLSVATAQTDLQTGSTLLDVDTVRVVRHDTTIVYAGLVLPVTTGSGGLTIVDQPDGQYATLAGTDRWATLNSRICYPDPAVNPPWTAGYDERTGIGSTVAADYLAANLGAGALADRQVTGIVIVDGVVGTSGAWSARLQPLGDLVARICSEAGIVCRLSTSFDGTLTVHLTAITDRHLTTVLSDLADLARIEQIHLPATASYVVAGGQGQLADRAFTTAGTAAGAARYETFSDQSSLSSSTELQQSADATLAGASASVTVRALLADYTAQTLEYLDDYDLGDSVAVELDTVRYTVTVDSVAVHVGQDRSVCRPTFGEASTNLLNGLIRDVAGLASRFQTNIA